MTPPVRRALGSLALAVAGAATGHGALPKEAPRVVDYSISVRLDAEKKEIRGRQRVVWRNPSSDDVPDLWFHLYLNAFRDNRSTFHRESRGRLRGDEAPVDGWGWIDLEELKLADGTDLLPALQFEHPDDDNADDRTVARVALPRAVLPGEELAFDAVFTARLPKVYARAGYFEDFFAVTQWFPKLAVYEPEGLRGRETGAWNCHQYHANSEFYADFGRYRVEITVPDGYVVGATGRRVAETKNADGTTTFVHEQEDVHDFAWSADPTFVEVVEPFVAADEVTPAELARIAELLDRDPEEVRLRDVEIRLLMQPSHRRQIARHLKAVKLSLKWFGLWYGAYPYPTITVIDPPQDATGATGVEYPTLFFNGSKYAYHIWPFSGIHEPEITAVHEFGHQYWYGLVGSNEFEEAWLDEGFNTYSTAKVLDLGYGERSSMVSFLGLEIGAAEVDQLGTHHERRFDRIGARSWEYSSNGQYGFNSYSRPALVLRTLEGILGETTMARVMRTYHERFRFAHPRAEDFYAVAEEISGRDLDRFFEQTIRGSGIFDPAVRRIESEPLAEFRGRRAAETGAAEAAIVTEEEAAERERAAEDTDTRGWRSWVDLRQLGEIELPVEVELRFEGKAPERRIWAGDRRWEVWTLDGPERLLSVEIDPDGKLPLDADRLNNALRTRDDRTSAHAWALRALAAFERTFAFLGL